MTKKKLIHEIVFLFFDIWYFNIKVQNSKSNAEADMLFFWIKRIKENKMEEKKKTDRSVKFYD
jgi:hypothetical protein